MASIVLVRRLIHNGTQRPGGAGTNDESQMWRLVCSVLQREGYQVVEASDGLDALDLVESGGWTW